MNDKIEDYNKPYIVKIGLDCTSCKKEGSIIIGMGSVYYYDTKEEYDSCTESGIEDFKFKYDINRYKIFNVECDDKYSKKLIESNEDDFIRNIIDNLLPELESNLTEKIGYDI